MRWILTAWHPNRLPLSRNQSLQRIAQRPPMVSRNLRGSLLYPSVFERRAEPGLRRDITGFAPPGGSHRTEADAVILDVGVVCSPPPSVLRAISGISPVLLIKERLYHKKNAPKRQNISIFFFFTQRKAANDCIYNRKTCLGGDTPTFRPQVCAPHAADLRPDSF